MNVKQTTTICVDNLCCASEETLIRKTLARLPDVEINNINVVTKTVQVSHSLPKENILQNLKSAGLQAHVQFDEKENNNSWLKNNIKLVLNSFSALLLLCGILGLLLNFQSIIPIILFASSTILSGIPVFKKGISSIRLFSLDMNFLMSIATLGAMAIGKWEEGAVVMFLFALAELLEDYSMKRTRNAIQSLMNLSPAQATVTKNGIETTVNVQSIHIGDHIIVRPGERIPLDGIVVTGTSTVNQAPITGESTPVTKRINDSVYAGSYNERGTLQIKATTPYKDTLLARIVRSVEEAQSTRAPLQNLVERFARIYTPIVFSLAVAVALIPPLLLHEPFGEWFYRSLVLLVIACPCALVISTPVTIICGLTNAARHGVLIKGGKYLELLSTVKAVAFDKTGTLTKGSPQVTDIISLNSYPENDILRLALLIEQQSEHHIATAIIQKASSEQITINDDVVQTFESLTGKGARATINGKEYFIGSHTLIEELTICSLEVEHILQGLERDGKTTIILAERTHPIGIIAISDVMRDDAGAITKQLHKSGIEKIIMLTGDNAGAAQRIAAETGIDEYYSEVLPDDKVAKVTGLKERFTNVLVVGDGINDAPALASASIGVAMGKSGTDIALESADIVLMSDELSKLPYIISLGKETISIIKQNIAIALVTKLVFLGLGLFGYATLWMAVIADDGATLVVILNGLRMLQWKYNGSPSISSSSQQLP